VAENQEAIAYVAIMRVRDLALTLMPSGKKKKLTLNWGVFVCQCKPFKLLPGTLFWESAPFTVGM